MISRALFLARSSTTTLSLCQPIRQPFSRFPHVLFSTTPPKEELKFEGIDEDSHDDFKPKLKKTSSPD